MSLNKLASAIAIICAFSSTQVLAQTAPPTADGWYTSRDAVSASPKPPCPSKKPTKDGEYKPVFLMEGGVYTNCAWSYVGQKPSFWSGLRDCFWSTSDQYAYDQCLRYGATYGAANGYSGGYTRPYVGRGPQCLRPGERYSCNGNGDLNCQKVPC